MAAGLGFKTFTTGEVLTAADVNGYLMQGVLVFASAAARTSAITSPQEGQYSFLKDTNALEYYDGAAWVGAPVGDITAVTAGTGISGGGSSGAVTITNDMATTITASGDIVVGTGSGTYDNLPIGSTGQVLTADTTVSPYKVKWATPAGGGGKVLQVIHASYATATSNSTSTYADTGLSATITPSSASSKVLVFVSQNGLQKSAGNLANRLKLNLLRGATQIAEIQDYILFNGSAQEVINSSATFNYLDSPSTTSATTYKTQFANPQNVASVAVQFNSVGTSHIVLMEIGA
jgi:hypothetical protein